jgi:hypothetical protein
VFGGGALVNRRTTAGRARCEPNLDRWRTTGDSEIDLLLVLNKREFSNMRARKSAAAAALVTAAIGLGISAAPVAAEPSPDACYGQTVKFFVQTFGSARAAAEAGFGDDPHAVQQGALFIRTFCATGGG